MAKLEQILQQVRAELGSDLISMDVVGTDGISIAGLANVPNLDTSPACARFAMVMKLATRVSDKLAIGGVAENLVTTDQAFIISRLLGDGSYYWALTVNKDAVLGSVRLVVNDYADQIWDAIPR